MGGGGIGTGGAGVGAGDEFGKDGYLIRAVDGSVAGGGEAEEGMGEGVGGCGLGQGYCRRRRE